MILEAVDGGPLAALLVKLAGTAWNRPRTVLGLALAVTVLAVGWIHDLRIDATFMGILDDDNPAAERLVEYSERFGAASGLLLVIEGGTEDERREVAAEAARVLNETPGVVDATARVDPDLVLENGLMLADDEQFAEIHSTLESLRPVLVAIDEEASLASGLGALRAEVAASFSARSAGPDAGAALDGVATLLEGLGPVEPRTLDEQLASAMSTQGEGTMPLRDGWFATSDGALYFVDARTSLTPLSVDIGMDDFAGIEAALGPIRAAHPDIWMEFSGLIPGAYQDQQNVLGKVMPLSTLSLVMVLGALMLLDRRWTTPLLVGCGLLMSVAWTFALVKLVLGVATLTSAAFGIMLFGLGVDYAVHVVVRFNDERASGHPGELAMCRALEHTGRGVVVGALTSMTAFALMVVSDFKAATHLGITAAMGLGCALFIMVGVLPAAIRIADGWATRADRVRMELKPLTALVRACLANPGRVLLVAALVLVASISQLPRYELETDLEKIITQDMPAMRANHLVSDALGASPEAVLSVSGSLEEARERAEEFRALPTVARVEGAFDLVPQDVDARLDRNRRLLPLIVDVELEPASEVDLAAIDEHLAAFRTVGARITAESTAAGRPDLADKGRRIKTAAEAARADLDAERLSSRQVRLFEGLGEGLAALSTGANRWRYGVEDLPPLLAERYVDGDAFLTYIYPTDYRVEFEFLQDFKHEVLSVDPLATGTLLVIDDLLVGGVDRLPLTASLVLLGLVVILVIDLRDAKKVLVALVPLLLGTTVAVAIIIALGIPISVLMLAAFPLVFGIGIDDGVHIIHRFGEGGEDPAAAVAATGKAILFTSLTTGLGFSILFLLNHRGLAGLATLVVIGVATCFVTSVTVLPVLARWASK
ncbi:MAG: MMPL family transporter [Proteobacteria bacterium]|nr:MMPL family transporter [Pseudomonadota bacterium]